MSDDAAPAAPANGAARLIWLRPNGEPVEYALERAAHVVGRDREAADLIVDEPLVSRAHARIEQRQGAWFVVDLGSTNFTRVNGEVVNERQLEDGDELRLARARCTFRLPSQ